MKPTEEQVILVNRLIREAIDNGGYVGGPYFSNRDELHKAMVAYRDNIWGKDSGILICDFEYDYPYFIFDIADEAVGQHKEME